MKVKIDLSELHPYDIKHLQKMLEFLRQSNIIQALRPIDNVEIFECDAPECVVHFIEHYQNVISDRDDFEKRYIEAEEIDLDLENELEIYKKEVKKVLTDTLQQIKNATSELV